VVVNDDALTDHFEWKVPARLGQFPEELRVRALHFELAYRIHSLSPL
jgi:hypothetical protein